MENINYNLEDLHQVQINLLKRLIEVCNANHLHWFLGFGSLLGAVREKRIIPWDDSIDVVMPYSDYARMTDLPAEVWGKDLFLQTYDSDPQYPKYYAKLRNSATTLVKADYVSCDINQGIYINIMPIIPLADDPEQRRKQLRDAKLYKALTENQPLPAEDGSLRLYASFLLGTASDHRRKKEREAMKARVIRYAEEKTKECFVLAGNPSLALPLSSAWFSSATQCDFEDLKANIPQGWHEWLTLRYGDYSVAPISDLQDEKISSFVTLNTLRPYTEYKGKTYCV